MFFKFLIIIFFSFYSFAVSSDPFTNEIGIIKQEEQQPEVLENEPEETAELEAEKLFDNEILDEEEIITDQITEVVENTDDKDENLDDKPIITVLNIDPIVGSPLSSYLLKGTALSKISKNNFERKKIKKIDQAKIPTTHTIQENETIENIAFRYGFPLREIELANALYPGSRKLVVGDKIVIPNRFHVVKEGQTLNSIAERYNISPIQLASYNDLNDESIMLIGDKLQLPFFIHVTSMNETMSEIAGRYEREIDELIEFNNFDENKIILNENQLIKIPIYANQNIDYDILDKKSINDYEIDRKNLAIVQTGSSQYMVREGDRIGNRDGIIVLIENTRMVVLENNIEFEFFINTPLTREAFAQLTNSNNENIVEDVVETIMNDDQNQSTENIDTEVETNIEDLFN